MKADFMNTVSDIKALFSQANESTFDALCQQYESDSRASVQKIISSTKRRIDKEVQEQKRLNELYQFERGLLNDHARTLAIGLDEVGRGCIAGPLAVGAVVLDYGKAKITLLNDSKQLKPDVREKVAEDIKESAQAWSVSFIDAHLIDELGISACLKKAFLQAIDDIHNQGIEFDAILLDGNPLNLDPRELNVVKGDSRCASIAASSIVAKVERDAYMTRISQDFPGYDFHVHKGYGTQAHVDALRKLGLTPLHRASFCSNFL